MAIERENPVYIPRNHKVEEALSAARTGDLAPFKLLMSALLAPFDRRPGMDDFEKPAPSEFGPYTTYCGT